MKACEQCAADRIEIGANHKQMSILSRTIGIILVYLPIFTLPFVIASAYSTYYSMVFCGAKNLKKWGDFIPAKDSHRYSLKDQITMDGSFKFSFSQSRIRDKKIIAIINYWKIHMINIIIYPYEG